MREPQLVLVAESLKEKTAGLISQLLNFGITEAKVTKFNNSFDLFISRLDDLNGGAAGRKAATTTLPQLFTEADTYIEKFNKYVDILDEDNPDLKVQWEIAKETKYLGVRHEAEEEVPVPVYLRLSLYLHLQASSS